MLNMGYSQNGLNLTKQFEGLRLSAYQDQVGVWTIGYGHTGADVHAGLTITQSQAEQFLIKDIAIVVKCVNILVTKPLAQNQFDALVDFTFNLGCKALMNSTLLKLVNKQKYEAAKLQFVEWDHAGKIVVPGLLERRKAEAMLWAQ